MTLVPLKTAISFAAVLSVAACDLGDGCPAPSKESPSAQEQARARSHEVYTTLRQMFENLPPRFADVTPCSDNEVWKSATDRDTVSFLAYQDLRYAVGAIWTPRTDSVVRFVTKSPLRYPPQSEFALDNELNVEKLMRTWDLVGYVAVVVPFREKQPVAYSESLGITGELEVQLVLYRKGEPGPICHAEFDVEGPRNIDFVRDENDSDAETRKKATKALTRGLCHRLRTTLTDEVRSFSEKLKPDSIDCNGVSP